MIPVSSPFNLPFRDAHKKNRHNNELGEKEKDLDLSNQKTLLHFV